MRWEVRFQNAEGELNSAHPYNGAMAVIELSPVLLLMRWHVFEKLAGPKQKDQTCDKGIRS